MKMEMVTATQLVGWGMGISEPFRQDSWKMYRIIWRNMYRTVQNIWERHQNIILRQDSWTGMGSKD